MNADPSNIEHNPFRAPEQDSQYQLLAADTEFLISDECVLCGSEVQLPAVCILSGDTDELVRKQSVLKWTPRWLVLVRGLLIIVALPMSGSLTLVLSNSGMLFGKQPVRGLELAPMLFVYAVFTAAIASIVAGFALTHRLRITWYIEASYLWALRKRRLQTLATGIVGIVLFVGSISYDLFVPFGIVGLLCVLLSASRVRIAGRPVFAGRHQGLNVINGLSSLFLGRVQAIIENHRAGQKHG